MWTRACWALGVALTLWTSGARAEFAPFDGPQPLVGIATLDEQHLRAVRERLAPGLASWGPKDEPPPDELLELHRWLCDLDYVESRDWVPRYVQVVMWESSYSSRPSIQWPKEFAGIGSERTFEQDFLRRAAAPGSRRKDSHAPGVG